MSRADLLARIRKCLRLASSANEHEAAQAVVAARRLMEEHGIDETDVAFADVAEHTAAGGRRARPPQWELVLIGSVQRALPVKSLLGLDGWVFIGVGAAPEIAGYAFVSLYRQLKRARSAYIKGQLRRCRPTRKRQRADAFCEGWASAVFRQIALLNPEPQIDDVVRAYLAQRTAGLPSVRSRASGIGRAGENDRDRGWSAGRAAELNRGVGTAATPLQIGAAR